MRTPARWAASFGALLLIIVTLGVGGTAFADPGNGQGNGAPSSTDPGPGNSEQARAGSGPAASDASEAESGSATSSQGKGSARGSSRDSSPAKGSTRSGSSQGSDHAKGNAGTSGTWNERQPNSNADENTGGANGQCTSYEGVYCSTRDGSASENGNNVGKASGRPCAGCVGKADNKNPQGQKPDAKRDGNNGYECDGNNGIAKGNPAHTTCRPSDNVERCPDGSVMPAGGPGSCAPPPPCPAGQQMVDGACAPPPPCPAGQQMVDGACTEVEPEVAPEVVVPPLPEVAGVEAFAPRPKPNAEVLGVQATAAVPAVLPNTGSSAGMGLLTGAGFLLLAAGAGLMLRRRLA